MSEVGFFHPEQGYWQVVGASDAPITIIVEPERVEVGPDGESVTIPAVTRQSTQIAELLASYLEGTVQVPIKPGANYEWDGEEWVYVEPAVTAAQVDAERDRRVRDAFAFGGTLFQLDETSQARITAMGADARFAVLAGAQEGSLRWADPAADFGWIATDNSIVPMDAQTMSDFADAAKVWVMRHTFAARALKDSDPIPADYADDSYWPD